MELNPPKNINLEDEVLLFGDVYSIDIDQAKELRVLLAKLRVIDDVNVQKCYDEFYKQYAKNYLVLRLDYYANIMNLKYKEVKFRKMKSRWGSCSSKGVITLNTQLIKIDKDLIDYIVVHELAHLIHMNHSRKFHDLVEIYMPGSKYLNNRLKNINLLY